MSEVINAITRPLVTIALVIVLCIGFMQHQVTQEQFIPIVTMIIGFWFGQRTGEQAAASVANAAAKQVVAETIERRGTDAPLVQRQPVKKTTEGN